MTAVIRFVMWTLRFIYLLSAPFIASATEHSPLGVTPLTVLTVVPR